MANANERDGHRTGADALARDAGAAWETLERRFGGSVVKQTAVLKLLLIGVLLAVVAG